MTTLNEGSIKFEELLDELYGSMCTDIHSFAQKTKEFVNNNPELLKLYEQFIEIQKNINNKAEELENARRTQRQIKENIWYVLDQMMRKSPQFNAHICTYTKITSLHNRISSILKNMNPDEATSYLRVFTKLEEEMEQATRSREIG